MGRSLELRMKNISNYNQSLSDFGIISTTVVGSSKLYFDNPRFYRVVIKVRTESPKFSIHFLDEISQWHTILNTLRSRMVDVKWGYIRYPSTSSSRVLCFGNEEDALAASFLINTQLVRANDHEFDSGEFVMFI